MRKGLLGLIVVGLLCWAGQASATSVTLSNGLVTATIDKGVVTAMSYGSGPDEVNAFTFVVYSPDLSPNAVKINQANLSIGSTGTQATFAQNIGSNVVVYAKYALRPGMNYLDMRFIIQAKNPAKPGITNVRTYLVLEPTVTRELRQTVESSPNSAWQMVNDNVIRWQVTADKWTDPKIILSSGGLGFTARVAGDDYMGDTAAAVWAEVNAGNKLPGGTVPGYAMNQPPAGVQGAVAMRVPMTPGVYQIPPDRVIVDARLEVVPEPCTMGLMLAGLAGLGVMRRRNRKN